MVCLLIKMCNQFYNCLLNDIELSVEFINFTLLFKVNVSEIYKSQPLDIHGKDIY